MYLNNPNSLTFFKIFLLDSDCFRIICPKPHAKFFNLT